MPLRSLLLLAACALLVGCPGQQAPEVKDLSSEGDYLAAGKDIDAALLEQLRAALERLKAAGVPQRIYQDDLKRDSR